MKDKIILATLLVFVQLLFSHTYQRDQVARYAHRYTRLTNDFYIPEINEAKEAYDIAIKVKEFVIKKIQLLFNETF